eukprot:304973_1
MALVYYILLLFQIRTHIVCQFTRSDYDVIWYSDLSSNDGWTIYNYVIFNHWAADCLIEGTGTDLCVVTRTTDQDSSIERTTNVGGYYAVSLFFNLNADTGSGVPGDRCQLLSRYDNSSLKLRVSYDHGRYGVWSGLGYPPTTNSTVFVKLQADYNLNGTTTCYWSKIWLGGVPTTHPNVPTQKPTWYPTLRPSASTLSPVINPTIVPPIYSLFPSSDPIQPTYGPTEHPTYVPTQPPINNATYVTYNTTQPIYGPTRPPTYVPTEYTYIPTYSPTNFPTFPTYVPTNGLTFDPTFYSSKTPTHTTNIITSYSQINDKISHEQTDDATVILIVAIIGVLFIFMLTSLI